MSQSHPPALILSFSAIVFLVSLPSVLLAQKVVVQDAGSGRKQELVYDASGKNVVEVRTIAPDGTVEVRNTMDYKPGFFVPQQTNITYWPGGKQPQLYSHVTYDENANFLSEVIEVYDQAGKHTGGHKVLHDPQTGIYHCWEWVDNTQSYKPVDCPSGEESGERPEGLRHITRAQATQFLAQARQQAAAERKSHSVALGRPTPASGGSHDLNAAIVLPAHLVPGQRVSGSVVQDLEPYQDNSSLTLIPVTISVDVSAEASPLRGWEVVVAGANPQPADSPFSFTVPKQDQVSVTLRQPSDPSHSISRSVAVGGAPEANEKSRKFEAPLVVVTGTVAQVSGAFSGNSAQAFAAIDNQPVRIVAETPHLAFLEIGEDVGAGQRSLIISDGPTLVAIPLVVAGVTFQPPRLEVKTGEPHLVIARVEGLDQLPEGMWRPGIYPPEILEQTRKLVPGFVPPAAREGSEPSAEKEKEKIGETEKEADRDEQKSGGAQEPAEHEREGDEANTGIVLFVMENGSPNTVSWRGSHDQRFVFTLKPESFGQGEFVYKFVADPSRSGSFIVKSALLPFLAPSTAAPFTSSSSARSKPATHH